MQIAVGLAIRGGVPLPSLSVAHCPTIESAARLQQEVCTGDKFLTICFGEHVQNCCCPQEVSSSYQVTCTIPLHRLGLYPFKNSVLVGENLFAKSVTLIHLFLAGRDVTQGTLVYQLVCRGVVPIWQVVDKSCKQCDEKIGGMSAVKRWLHKACVRACVCADEMYQHSAVSA